MAGRSVTDEQRRVAAVRRSELLDDAGSTALDRLATLASRVLRAPVSLVTIMDDQHLRWSGQHGLPQPQATERTTTFSRSLCRLVVLEDQALVVDDARTDPRTADHLAVTELGVGSYAGVPVRAPGGEVLGTLCAIDVEPREWTEEDLATLADIGEAASAEIEARALVRERDLALREQHEVTMRLHRKQARLRALADIGEIVSAPMPEVSLAQAVAHRMVPEMCDWCLVELLPVDAAAELEPRTGVVAIGASSIEQRDAIEELHTLARGIPEWKSPTLAALGSNESIHIPEVRLADLTTGDVADLPPRLPELLADLRLGVVSAVPVTLGESRVGAVSFVRRSGFAFDENEQSMHREVARRVAMAVESARLRDALEARARAAQVIERIGDGVVLLDGDRHVVLWNPAAERMTGVDACDALGVHIRDVLPALVEAIEGGDRRDDLALQFAVSTPRGRRWIAIVGDRVADGALFALRDITAEHELELARDEVIATVSHQLRTPVTSVLAAAITLQRTDIDLDAATRALIVDTIVQQGHRLEELCDDVLLAYRLDSGVHRVDAVSVVLAPILHELATTLSRTASTRIELRVDVPDDLTVVGDEHALRQVFGNLIENALKYSPAGGTIDVLADPSQNDDDVVVLIRDHGIGIPPEQHDAIFERFHRLDPDMAQGVGGAGLGLFVVRELLALMGGSIRVQSHDVGTTMAVSLPRA